MSKVKYDLTNQTFGYWSVLAYAGGCKWWCRCRCGKEKAIHGYTLLNNQSTNCGCGRTEKARAAATSHGLSSSGTYRLWNGIKTRCWNKNSHAYQRYGGRGITICDRWLDYRNFLEDMGERPSPQHSLERINNDLGYSPENCCWATAEEQANNTRRNRLVTINGRVQTAARWIKELGCTRTYFRYHYMRKDKLKLFEENET